MIGECVANIYGSVVRYGVVTDEKTESGWRFFKVKWHNDSAYEETMKHRSYLLRQEYSKDYYRVDELLFVDLDRTLEALTTIALNSAERGV